MYGRRARAGNARLRSATYQITLSSSALDSTIPPRLRAVKHATRTRRGKHVWMGCARLSHVVRPRRGPAGLKHISGRVVIFDVGFWPGGHWHCLRAPSPRSPCAPDAEPGSAACQPVRGRIRWPGRCAGWATLRRRPIGRGESHDKDNGDSDEGCPAGGSDPARRLLEADQ